VDVEIEQRLFSGRMKGGMRSQTAWVAWPSLRNKTVKGTTRGSCRRNKGTATRTAQTETTVRGKTPAISGPGRKPFDETMSRRAFGCGAMSAQYLR